ncbi:DinB/UmuC family translesion DNA polymerase [Streptomyces alanosinicus]|uniref:DinB/UmuC family translesion DNA polymerase n=1 Tax=Streptomyces alanosinicus TaxID=68171 RepID=UPI0035711D44
MHEVGGRERPRAGNADTCVNSGGTAASGGSRGRSVTAEARNRWRHPTRCLRVAVLSRSADGRKLRTDGQVASALTLTVHYADRSTTARKRVLPEPTAHTAVLAGTAQASGVRVGSLLGLGEGNLHFSR